MFHLIGDSVVTFFVVLDPIGTAAVFAGLMRGASDEARNRMAWRSTIIASLLLFAFASGGAVLFEVLGVSIAAFRIAGGILLFLLATDMVFARPSGIRNPTRPEQEEAANSRDISVFPLAFPLLAGPGALTSVVLSIGRVHTLAEAGAVIASLIAVLALTLAALLWAVSLLRALGVTGANVVGRVLGIILAALAVQNRRDDARHSRDLALLTWINHQSGGNAKMRSYAQPETIDTRGTHGSDQQQ